MTATRRYAWCCVCCGARCSSALPGGAYAFLCPHCDLRTPSERLQLRIAYMNRTSGHERTA